MLEHVAADPPRLVIAFDFGKRRIGVACGDTLSKTARPLSGVANTPNGPQWERIAALLAEWRPALIVVGLPYNVDDSESSTSLAARAFAMALTERHALPVQLVDERYSSLDAAGRLASARRSGSRKRGVVKADVDATAACVILERWFTEST